MTLPQPSGSVCQQLRQLVATGRLDHAPYGQGDTHVRLEELASIAARNLSLARLAEAHLDAVTILREAGHAVRPGSLYGVWASDNGTQRLRLINGPAGLMVTGTKGFCTGAHLVDRALITVVGPDGSSLIDIDARHPRITYVGGSWQTVAFEDTNTLAAEFEAVPIIPADVVGRQDWYLNRVGFWQGALAPAACWAGGAIGLADHCHRLARQRAISPHQMAHLGRLDVIRWQLSSLVREAGRSTDTIGGDRDETLLLAHRLRASVEQLADSAIFHALRCHGPRLLAHDAWATQHIAELQLYIRQHHAEADLEQLGQLVAGGRDEPLV